MRPVLGLVSFAALFFVKIRLILSPKNAATKTPATPPIMLAKKIVHGDSPKAKPAGIAAYISKLASPATVKTLKIIRQFFNKGSQANRCWLTRNVKPTTLVFDAYFCGL